ncbi:hypothetical protein QFZ96_001327 [Paraburkholderia youngii]
MRVNRFYSVRHMIPYSFEELGVTCSIVISKNIFGPDFWEFLESFFSIPYMLGGICKMLSRFAHPHSDPNGVDQKCGPLAWRFEHVGP